MPSYVPLIETPETSDFTDDRPLRANTEGLKALGFFPQNSTSNDEAVGVTRDASGNLVLTDGTNGALTLSQVASGIGGNVDGGFAASVFLVSQNIDGGDANG